MKWVFLVDVDNSIRSSLQKMHSKRSVVASEIKQLLAAAEGFNGLQLLVGCSFPITHTVALCGSFADMSSASIPASRKTRSNKDEICFCSPRALISIGRR